MNKRQKNKQLKTDIQTKKENFIVWNVGTD